VAELGVTIQSPRGRSSLAVQHHTGRLAGHAVRDGFTGAAPARPMAVCPLGRICLVTGLHSLARGRAAPKVRG
jgi:hypothetical protein